MRTSRCIDPISSPRRSRSAGRRGGSVRLALLGLLALLAPGTARAGLEVDILYDHDADFGAYRTYRWVTEAPQENPEGHLVDERIKQTVATELAPKGLEPAAPDETPDLLFTYSGYVEDDLLIEGVRYELAPHVVWTGAAPMEVTRSSREGTLILDFADADTKTVVWSGVVHGRARSTPKLRDKIRPAIRKLLQRYPPR